MADRITNKNVAVGTSAINIADELLPTQRKEIFIVNTSTAGQKITIAINQDAVANVGLVLSPGGTFSSSQDGYGFYPVNYHFSAISDAVNGSLSIVERIGDAK